MKLDPNIQFMLCHKDAQAPSRDRDTDAGFDLYCVERVDIPAGRQAVLPTGIKMAIPSGWYGRVAPRSGLATCHGINVHAGVVDSSYRGEIKVALINHGDDLVEFRPGDRIAQIIIERCSTGDMVLVDYLENTDRGEGGFGSSGR